MSDRKPELAKRYTKFDRKAKNAFLRNLELTGNFNGSAQLVGCTAQNIYAHMRRNEAFKKQVEKAKAVIVNEAEVELKRRAIEGVEKGIYFKGELVATERQYSDMLLVELLKANAPEKYGTRLANITVNNNNLTIENKTIGKLATLLGVELEAVEHVQDAEFTALEDQSLQSE